MFEEGVKGRKVAKDGGVRLRDGLTGNRYWEREEDKMYRICKGRKKTWEHI